MERLHFVGDLEIDQDLRYQVHEWRVERVGWVLLGLLLVLASLGTFGGGVLSRASAEEGAVRVEYERFTRAQSRTTIQLLAPMQQQKPMPVELRWAPRTPVRIETIVPEPERSEVTADGAVYYFTVAPDTDTGRITFEYRIEDPGEVGFQISAGGATFEIDQFVYP